MNPETSDRSLLKTARCVQEALLDFSDHLGDLKRRVAEHDGNAPGVTQTLNMVAEIEELIIETLDELRADEQEVYSRVMVLLKG